MHDNDGPPSPSQVVDTAWRGQAGLDVSDVAEGDKSWGVLADRKGLVVGDIAALTLFAYVGRASHGMAAFDLGVLFTALPFFVGALAVVVVVLVRWLGGGLLAMVVGLEVMGVLMLGLMLAGQASGWQRSTSGCFLPTSPCL